MKKCLLFLLTATVLLGMLAGCSGKEQPPVQTGGDGDTGTDTGAPDVVAEYPTHPEWEPREFHLLALNGYNDTHRFVDFEETGDPIVSASVARTNYVQTNYNIDLILDYTGDVLTGVRNDFLGGGGNIDLVYPHPTSGIVTLMTEGYLANLLECGELTLGGEWYNQSQIENYQVNGKLYLAASDYSITGQGFAGIVYNKPLYESQGFEQNLYEEVKNGTWTYEMMLEMIEGFNSMEEDGVAKTYGLILHQGYLYQWTYAFGENILVRNGDGAYEIGFDSAHLSDIADAVYDLVWNNYGVLRGSSINANFPTSEMFTTYSGGRGLFFTYDIGGLYNLLRDLSFDIGFLPTPKFDAAQEDYRVLCASGFFGIPALAPDVGQSAVILEILSRYSYREMRPTFFEAILQGRLADEPEDYEMLELMHSKKYFDFGVTLDAEEQVRNILYNVVVDGQSRNVSGYMRAKRADFDRLAELANNIS